MAEFILVYHDALRAGKHFDLRFEMPDSDIWASFVFKKDPTKVERGEKSTCVRTTDHSRENALFTGTIESGYGAGTLRKYDSGRCDVLMFKNSHIVVRFKGKKLKGLFHLLNVASISGKKSDYKKKMFLLFPAKEDYLSTMKD